MPVFNFENSSIRVVGTPTTPLFVVTDVCAVLTYSNVAVAIARHVMPEDVIKVRVLDTKGRPQTVNAVNESGLYCLIFGSKLEKAKEFKRWVTSEVLPSIRKTGSYTNGAGRSVTPRPPRISDAQCAMISEAVKRQARIAGVYTQTIYERMHNHFNIPSYTNFTVDQFNAVLEYIKTFTKKSSGGGAPTSSVSKLPSNYVILDAHMAERLVHFLYYWRYFFRPELDMIYQLLRTVDSPKAARFFEVMTGLRLPQLERLLEEQGYSVKALPCYKALPANQRLPN